MSDRGPVKKYVVDPMAPFPKRWRDHVGSLRVLAGPFEGWLMVKRPHAEPFCLKVSTILNATGHPVHGPFEAMP